MLLFNLIYSIIPPENTIHYDNQEAPLNPTNNQMYNACIPRCLPCAFLDTKIDFLKAFNSQIRHLNFLTHISLKEVQNFVHNSSIETLRVIINEFNNSLNLRNTKKFLIQTHINKFIDLLVSWREIKKDNYTSEFTDIHYLRVKYAYEDAVSVYFEEYINNQLFMHEFLLKKSEETNDLLLKNLINNLLYNLNLDTQVIMQLVILLGNQD